MGGDFIVVMEIVSVLISIHAPAWGATVPNIIKNARFVISIHAPAWGATEYMPEAFATLLGISIHAPAWGATAGL